LPVTFSGKQRGEGDCKGLKNYIEEAEMEEGERRKGGKREPGRFTTCRGVGHLPLEKRSGKTRPASITLSEEHVSVP